MKRRIAAGRYTLVATRPHRMASLARPSPARTRAATTRNLTRPDGASHGAGRRATQSQIPA
jgi:hypothetical protein